MKEKNINKEVKRYRDELKSRVAGLEMEIRIKEEVLSSLRAEYYKVDDLYDIVMQEERAIPKPEKPPLPDPASPSYLTQLCSSDLSASPHGNPVGDK